MQAVNNYIIVEKIKQGPKKVGGLILTEDVDADNRYIKAKVYYDKHAGHGVQYKETLYYVIRSMDVVLID
jgi:hypothetical protein